MNLGFIGTGAIAEAVITGMLNANAFDGTVIVSERNRVRSTRLAQNYPQVTVEADNQKLVDRSDWVLISVLPDQAESVLQDIRFRREQFVISMVAGRTLQSLKELVAPASNVFRIIPLPPIEIGLGPLPITPPNDDVAALFSRFGTAIQLEDEEHFSALSASSAVMASFYQWVATLSKWTQSQGVPPEEATQYNTSMIRALAQTTIGQSDAELQNMAQECLTEGGLNEQVLNESLADHWFSQMASRLDRIAQRLEDAKTGSV